MLQMPARIDFSFNKDSEPGFVFYDSSLLQDIKVKRKEVYMFFTLLAVCHTVMPATVNGERY